MKICSITECDRPHVARGFCRRHYDQWSRTGVTTNPKLGRRPNDVVSYGSAHGRVARAKGPASQFVCVDCGERQAEDWSYRGLDPDEQVTETGVRYGCNPDYFEPRDRVCHRAYDRDRRYIRKSIWKPNPQNERPVGLRSIDLEAA